jgi:iron complex outermembrane receptor protein
LGGQRAHAQSLEDLQHMSIAQLADIDVSSVSKTPEALNQAPASIYVITHDDIMRSGANSIPEILRLAPNLQVYETSASQYVITARGFNGNAADQNFPTTSTGSKSSAAQARPCGAPMPSTA